MKLHGGLIPGSVDKMPPWPVHSSCVLTFAEVLSNTLHSNYLKFVTAPLSHADTIFSPSEVKPFFVLSICVTRL